MVVSLSHSRTRIEYILNMESMNFLVTEEYNPVLKTTNVVKIAMLPHQAIYEPVMVGSVQWQDILMVFHSRKQEMIDKAKAQAEAEAKAKAEATKTEKPATKKKAPKKKAPKKKAPLMESTTRRTGRANTRMTVPCSDHRQSGTVDVS